VTAVDPASDSGLAAFLLDHPAEADQQVVHWADGSLTLGELSGATQELARLLVRHGVADREPVACVVNESATALIAMFAVWLAGGVYLPVNARLADAEVREQLTAGNPRVVVAGEADAGRVPGHWDRLVASDRVTAPDRRSWTELAGLPWSGMRPPPGTALIMRTSGTTGPSKPVVLGHRGVRDGIDTIITQLRGRQGKSGGQGKDGGKSGGRPPMANLVPTSLALWAGIWNALFAFRLGAPLVLLDRFDTVRYAELVRRFGIRSTVLAPAMMTMLSEDPRVTDLAPLTFVRSITAPLTPGQARRFHDRFGVDVLNCYGQTELGGEVAGWTAADIREFGAAKLGAVGRPHPGIAIRILADDRRELPASEVGEIWIRSPFAADDIAGEGASDIADRVVDGFLRTGDLGQLDSDGFLWIEGRVSDMINRGGLKVVPQEVEEVLRRHPGVADACVAGVPDPRLGEVPVAWIRPAAGAAPEQAELQAFVRRSLAGYKVPVAVRLIQELPRNEIGKVLRRELVAGYETAVAGDAGEVEIN
jgi:acyl-CoA synthetase (AMP-forming)/AMP-acid ligase II